MGTTEQPKSVRYETAYQGGPGVGRAVLSIAKPPEKPPSFIDRNLKAGKLVLKEGAREAVVEFIKWLLLGRKRQPAAEV